MCVGSGNSEPIIAKTVIHYEEYEKFPNAFVSVNVIKNILNIELLQYSSICQTLLVIVFLLLILE